MSPGIEQMQQQELQEKNYDDQELKSCIKKHIGIGAGGAMLAGLVPVAGGIIAAIILTCAVWSMYVKMAGITKVKMSIKVILSGIITNIVASVIMIPVSFIPAVGSVVGFFLDGIIACISLYISAYFFRQVLRHVFTHQRASQS